MKLRPATIHDAQILFAWRADPITRAASHNTGPLNYESHCKWLKESLTNPNRAIQIAEIDSVAIGTVRSDMQDGLIELSWTISPEHRGKGFGTKMVSIAIGSLSGHHVRAEIKETNVASVRIAESCGMKLSEKRNGILYFVS